MSIQALQDIDPEYRASVSKHPRNERIAYCEKLIDKAQQRLAANNRYLSKQQKVQLKEIIMSAQREVIQLMRNAE
jgi:hypothetical protein